MLRLMLDTDICIYAMRNQPDQIRRRFMKRADQLCISSVTFMELCYGVENSADPARNRQTLANFTGPLAITNYDEAAAVHTGEIRALLKRVGKSIGPYDAMIAGHARSKGFALATNNLSEFARVPGLEIEDWLA